MRGSAIAVVATVLLLSLSAFGFRVAADSVMIPLNEGMMWEEYEWGGLESNVTSEGVEISGEFDGTETTPLTGGFNNYFLLSENLCTDNVWFSAEITVADFVGTEAIVGIGIRSPSEMDFCYRDSILWCWYHYSSVNANSIGWLHECLDGTYERTTVNDTDLMLGQTYKYEIRVDFGILGFYIDGQCMATQENPLTEFNVFMEVAVKYDGTYIDATFEDITLIYNFYPVPEYIYIDGNDEFTGANGVHDGSGTAEDPYIIEGYEFHDYYVAIWILNTDAHCLIRNIVASGGTGGIYLYYAENVTLENVTLWGNSHAGTYLNTVKNCHVLDSNVHNNGHEGIIFRHSENVTVSGNAVWSNDWEGVMVEYSKNVGISNNTIFNNGFLPDPEIIEYLGYGGVYLVSVDECEIAGNWIGVNANGICAFESKLLLIVANGGICGSDIGVQLGDCIKSRIYWNNIHDNDLQAEDIWSEDLGRNNANRWDNGGSGGNYWSDYVGPGPYKFDDNMDRRPSADPLYVEWP